MTDQQMHERLQAAGARFREQTAATTSVELPATSRRRPRVLLAVAAAAVVLLVAGLALGLRGSKHHPAPSGDLAGLVGNVWLLSPDGTRSTAALYISRSGALVADDECRLIGAKAAVSGDRLTITDVSVRLKPCLDQYGPGFYATGTQVLHGSVRFHIGAQAMTITRPGVGSLRFVLARNPIPPPSLDIPTLTGTDWVAPNGSVLRIDPATGRLSGGYCGGRAIVAASTIRFTDCPRFARETWNASISGASLVIGHSHNLGVPTETHFRWRPTDPSIIDPASLTDRTWHLESVNGSPASSGNLRITSGTAVVDDGCTTYRRPVQVATGTFAIRGGVPAHACTDQASTADSFVFNDPATWAIRDGELIVYGGGSQEFALVYGSSAPAGPQQHPAALLAHAWQAPPVRGSSDSTVLTFTESGYRVAHRCYYLDGTAQRGPDIIRFDPATSVPHSCPRPQDPSSGRAAAAIDKVFSGAVHWSMSDGALTLVGGGGTLLLRPVDSGPAALLGPWTLTSYVPGAPGTTAPAFPTPRVVFTFGPQAISAEGTKATAVTYTGDRIEFGQPWTDNLSIPRGPALGVQAERFVFGSLLQGTVTYHLSGNSLIIVNPKVGELNFTRRP